MLMRRQIQSGLTGLLLFFVFILPLAASLALLLPLFADAEAFTAFIAHPQFWGGLKLTLITGIGSTILSLVLAVLIVSQWRTDRLQEAGVFLAVPHLALAIGLAFLIAPTGLVSRLIATLVTGWTTPPQWIAAQDPNGFSLMAALVLKETPFLVWALASLLNRDDLRAQFAAQSAVARSFGHGPRSTWLRIVLPQLLPRIIWPLVAVLTYGLTVVDMALVIGPTQPPTLAEVIWSDLNDGELANNARGGAGVILLSAVILALLLLTRLLMYFARPFLQQFYARHPRDEARSISLPKHFWRLWQLLYAMVALVLLLQSLSGHWPFPRLLAEQLTIAAWLRLFDDFDPFVTSLALALATSAIAIVAAIAWMEGVKPSRDPLVLAACGLSLCLPSLVIGLGQYRLFLQLGITGTGLALFLAHCLPVAAYVFIMLHGPYRAYDRRWASVSAGLLAPRRHFLLRIKWPMLKAPIFAAAAVGFAVSIAQFVPAQLAAAGRFSTLPMEAVTLSSGGNRAVIAAYALALTVLPLAAFLAAARLGRPRWSSP